MAEQREINYVNKSFTDLRQQLVDYAKNYFPDTYNDFSPTSPGMMFIEMAAYVGDILSFYQDIQLQETLLQYAQEPGNLYAMAYMMGYRPKLTSVATVELDVYQRVPAIVVGGQFVPDFTYGILLTENTQLQSTVNPDIKFLIQDSVNFSFSSSYDPTGVTVYSTAGNTVTQFLLKKSVSAISAEVKTATYTCSSPERFKTFTLADTNIAGILDIVDSNNNTWTEVPYLAQDTVFNKQTNTATDSQLVPYTMTLQRVPRRFVTRFDKSGNLLIQFGAGTSQDSDIVITPDPTNVGLGKTTIGVSRIDQAFDPSNFLFTGTYGLAPSNSTLTVRYLVGGGIEANAPADSLTTILASTRISLNPGYENTLVITNPTPATGGKDGDTSEELRQNSIKAYSEQLRAVTREDYTIRALSLPSQFGSIAKVFVSQDQLSSTNSNLDNILDSNPLALSMFVLAYTNDKHLTSATDTLKYNLKTYLSQYRILTDAINIKDAFIVNIGIRYDVVLRPGYIGRDVLLKCTEALKNYFEITKFNINQPINLSEVYTTLDKARGVQTVQNVEIFNKVGGNYSQFGYDVKGATKNNIVYPSYDPCIFEVKFPDVDIEGRVTSL